MKKIACMMVGIICLTSGAFGASRYGPFATGLTSTGDNSGSAFGAGLKYEWLFSEKLGIDLRGGYVNDGDIGLVPLMFGPIVVFPLNSISFTLGAGGLYGIPTDGDADSALGFYAAGGIRGPISDKVEWFAEVEYANVKGDDNEKTTYYPWGFSTISEPYLDFEAVGLNIGILWGF